MKRIVYAVTTALIFFNLSANSQTNVFDDIIAASPNHTYLEAAILQEGLEGVLQDDSAQLTVFAPNDAAFDSLAAALNTNITGLLALPNLTDILTYHVLGASVASTGITNGDIVNPVSSTNTLKLTVSGAGDVYVNQAQVVAADISADNGMVHVLDKIVLPVETVVDVAIDNGFSTLTTAVITAELLPALTDPLSSYTVFAPTNDAFSDLASALNTDINGLLALSNLADILTYHVIGMEVASSSISNGAIVEPLSSTNSLKLSLTESGDAYLNQAQITAVDIASDNGLVHVLDQVVLPVETVVDVAIDNGFTTLTSAVIEAELLATLSDPLAEYTVFAPTNDAFLNFATSLNTDLAGLLASEDLADILLYHVVAGNVLSTALTNGAVSTLNGNDINVDVNSGVKINNTNVTIADIEVDNGVVHVIDGVLTPIPTVIEESFNFNFKVYPNPAVDYLRIDRQGYEIDNATIYDIKGQVILQTALTANSSVDVQSLESGMYLLELSGEKVNSVQRLQIL
ncbi:MAG: T9SS type A sorting domain-containing protein [Flavobacteriales bacterium]|jgi:transforming growth factor-beta-induced protein|nr:T9SS type A sorting domain-containing protein [Flavobacteriales bacterium]MBT4706226.1 T9SS type A sorting domain-containing protein [Flavobacteriales bacterium]MBT5133155.1 T9SS type A sorting domain-containing protein [Flavobacteriales bacterium]MBT6133747.1 T9SS type A sorting domain-containing protein [Flavobacteriales bacterium]MBT6383961.1 T9SS type A sorting domain-containing protein [Flavobacteriales bacterium]